jgi:PAS domain S-box-containing protein
MLGMTTDPEVLRAERFVEIGTLIQRDIDTLIERWCRRAVREQPNAQRVHKDALRDQLATLLHAMGRSLAESDDPEVSLHRASAIEHGEQRWETGWSLPEVVRDYQILRLVILDYLEENLNRSLRPKEVKAVGLALDEAIAASVGMYVSSREEFIRQVERDRSERAQQAEEALQRWRHLFQHAGWGVAIIDPHNDTFQTVNPAFGQMHGQRPEDLLGRPITDVLAPESREELPAHVHAVHDQGHHAYEAIHVRKDGSRFPVLTDVTASKDREGKVLYRAASFQDISERKRLEESLRREAEVLQESERRKDEFLAVLAHELRNFLAPTVNAVEMLRHVTSDDATLHQARDVVERQIRQMGRVVEELLDVTRIAKGQIVLRKERLELAMIVAQAIQTSDPLIQAQRHQLSVSLPTEPLWLEGDSARFVQIIANLLNNAAKYTEPGGRIWLTGQREGHQVVVRIRDTGLGIPKEMLTRIFDPFTQLERDQSHSQGGLGIGLALARRLVELHGGKITANSEGPGKGSEFVLRLPAGPDGQSTTSPPIQTSSPASPGRHLLLIEDNADGRETMKTLLQLWGHHVEVASDGRQGLELALKTGPQVALIDIGLPLLNGFEVAQRVRAALGDRVYLIALTGYGQADDRRRTLEAGFDAHIVKPVDPEELSQLLGSLPVSPS